MKQGQNKKRKNYYLPLETYLRKGSINFVVPRTKGTKLKDSSLAFFDLNDKEATLYDLKKWFKKENPESKVKQATNSNHNNSLSLNTWKSFKKHIFGLRNSTKFVKNRDNLELYFLENKQIRSISHFKAVNMSQRKMHRKNVTKEANIKNQISSLPDIDWSQWVLNSTPYKKVDKVIPFSIKNTNIRQKQISGKERDKDLRWYVPDQNRQFLNWANSWNLLSNQLKYNKYVTGRISRSLKRAGLCVWLGGVTSFLPYQEYSLRNRTMPSFEGHLKTFQVVSLNPSNLNCVLTRDKAIQSIIYRSSRSPEEDLSRKKTLSQLVPNSRRKSTKNWKGPKIKLPPLINVRSHPKDRDACKQPKDIKPTKVI